MKAEPAIKLFTVYKNRLIFIKGNEDTTNWAIVLFTLLQSFQKIYAISIFVFRLKCFYNSVFKTFRFHERFQEVIHALFKIFVANAEQKRREFIWFMNEKNVGLM